MLYVGSLKQCRIVLFLYILHHCDLLHSLFSS